MKTYKYVKEISDYYSYWDFGEDEGQWVDREATARVVWRWLNKENILTRIRKFDEEWKRTEYLHLSIADYFSMFEPVAKAEMGRGVLIGKGLAGDTNG